MLWMRLSFLLRKLLGLKRGVHFSPSFGVLSFSWYFGVNSATFSIPLQVTNRPFLYQIVENEEIGVGEVCCI